MQYLINDGYKPHRRVQVRAPLHSRAVWDVCVDCHKRTKVCVVRSLLGSRRRSTSAGSSGGNLNTHLAYAMTCNFEPVDKSVFYSSRRILVRIRRPRWDECLLLLGGKSKNLESDACEGERLLLIRYHELDCPS